MYKPVFWIVVLLHSTAPVLAQNEETLMDSVVAVMEPAGEGEAASAKFDRIGEKKPVVLRTVPKRLVDSLKAADDFWYANRAPSKKKERKEANTGPSLFQKRWFRNLLWSSILGSFIAVVFWYLVSSNIFLFRRRAKELDREEDVGAETDDIFSLRYDSEIEAATAAGNYRLAVRLWYLQTLKILAEKSLIDYRYGRTNQDYVSQLYRHTAYQPFSRLTRNFEYTWYGQFPLSAAAYDMMRADFVQFQKSLS